MSYQDFDTIDLSNAVVGSKYTVLPSGGNYGTVTQVLIVNNSGFGFAVTSSSDGTLPPLQAFSVSPYNAPSNGGSLTVQVTGGEPAVLAAQLSGQYGIGSDFTGVSPGVVPVGQNTKALVESATPTVSGTTVTYTFPAIATGQAANVTVSVPSSPVQPTWTVSVGGKAQGTMIGANSLANVYVAGGDAVTITATDASLSGFSGDAIEVGVVGDPSVVTPGTPLPSSNVVSIGNEVTMTGDVTATITGTTDVNVTNANLSVTGSVDVTGTADVNVTNATIPVSGSVDANITNATLTVDGTVDIAAGQVVQVENTSGGSITVAGTIDINGGTLDVNNVAGGTVDISALGTGTQLLATASSTTTSVTVTPPSGTGSLLVTNLWSTTGSLPVITSVNDQNGVALTAIPVPISAGGGQAGRTNWYIDIPLANGSTTYTIDVSAVNAYNWYVYANTGVGLVATLPLPTPPLVQYLPNAASVTFTPLQTTKALIIITNSGTYPTVTDQLGTSYAVHPMGIDPSTQTTDSWVSWGFDATTLITEGTQITVSSSVDLILIAQVDAVPPLPKLPTQTVTIANPAGGFNWSYTLTYPARVLAINCSFFTDSTAGNRYPYVNLSGIAGGYDSQPIGSALGTSTAVNIEWRAGSLTVPFFSPGANTWLSTIPDWGFLPAGSTITSGVSGMSAGDQWKTVSLVLGPA